MGKNRYGPLTGAEPILLDFDQGHGGFREQRSRPLVAAGIRLRAQPPPLRQQASFDQPT